MKVCGIICEFNPFHNGHAHLIRTLREAGAEVVVCLMSGSFVQRGEPAVADKFTRARCALGGGADVVLELSFPYCMASAEFFARAGVDILTRMGVDTLGFGCESFDADSLRETARVLLMADFEERYRQLCRAGKGSAAAYFEAYRAVTGVPLSDSPNDILAVNYVKELLRLGRQADIFPVRRNGDGYNETSIGASGYPSARALRALMREGGVDALRGYVPDATLEALEEARNNGLCMSRIENIEHDILTFLRVSDPDSVKLPDADSSLSDRIFAVAREVCGYDELIRRASASNYTAARVRRTVLGLMLGVTVDDWRREAAYVQLLAANSCGRTYLASRRRAGGLPVITKPADAVGVCGGERHWTLAQRSEALWCMTLPTPCPAAALTKMHPWFDD